MTDTTAALPVDWTHSAACRGSTHRMYPELQPAKRPAATRDTPAVAAARAVCAACPVIGECLAHVLRLEGTRLEGHPTFHRFPRDGIFAGMTPRERRDLTVRNRVRLEERRWQARRERCIAAPWLPRMTVTAVHLPERPARSARGEWEAAA